MEMLRAVIHLAVDEEPLLVHRFYDKLFDQHPEARPLFADTDMGRQEQMLGEMLVAVVDHLDNQEWLRERLIPLGARHQGYGVTPEMYTWVSAALWQTMGEILAEIAERRGIPDLLSEADIATLKSEYDLAIGAAAILMLSGYTPAEARAGDSA